MPTPHPEPQPRPDNANQPVNPWPPPPPDLVRPAPPPDPNSEAQPRSGRAGDRFWPADWSASGRRPEPPARPNPSLADHWSATAWRNTDEPGRQPAGVPNPFTPTGTSQPPPFAGERPWQPRPESRGRWSAGRRRRPAARAAAAVVPLGIGAAFAIALGVYARVHNPTGVAVNIAGFSSTQSVKTWLATVAFLLAILQLVSAFAVYGRLPGPSWSDKVHKWSGRIAVLFTLPVVAHCLYALGFQYDTGRVLIHSVLGCFFFGAFAAKMLVLSRDDGPRWLLPVMGGAVFSGLVGLWLTSSLWFFTTVGLVF